MAAVDQQRTRALKIKTGVVKRLAKEKIFYEKEADGIQAKINKMKEEGKDEYDIRKMEEVMGESKMMIPDCQRKHSAAYEELKKLLETESDLAETEEYKAAQAILEETKPSSS